MDFPDLNTFVVVAEERSFVRAAARLGRSQPAVTLAVQRLEAAVRQPLFLRRVKPPELTDAGRVLLGYARRLCLLREEATFAMADPGGDTRRSLRIGLNESFVPLAVSALKRLGARQPDVRVELRRARSSDLLSRIACGDVHCALFAFQPAPTMRLPAFPLGHDPIVLVTAPGHTLAERRSVSLDEITREPLIAHGEASALRTLVLKLCEQRGLVLRMAALLPTLDAMRQAVALGLGATILPFRAVRQEVAHGRLRAVPIGEPWAEQEIWLSHGAEHGLPAAAKIFGELLGELGGSGLEARETKPSSRGPLQPTVAASRDGAQTPIT